MFRIIGFYQVHHMKRELQATRTYSLKESHYISKTFHLKNVKAITERKYVNLRGRKLEK